MSLYSRTFAMVLGAGLLGACSEEDAGSDETSAGDATTTTPCAETPVATDAVPAETIVRFENAWSTEFVASGSWVVSADDAVLWSHPVVGSSAALTLSVAPGPGAGWTRFATGSEDCTSRLGQKVAVTVRTADGALADTFDGRLSDAENGALSLAGQVEWSSLAGSLRTASVEPNGAMRVLSRFDLELSAASLDGTLTGFAEYSEADGQVVQVKQFLMATW